MPDDSAPDSRTPGSTANGEATVALKDEGAVQSAFDRVFGDAGDDAGASTSAPTGRRQRIKHEQEEAESLASLDAANDELDLGGRGLKPTPDEGDEPDDGGDEGGAELQEADGRPDGEDGDTPTLDPLLRHAARRGGFSDDEVNQLVAESPELAERTFQKLHTHYSELSARYAQLGQQAQQQEGGQPDPRDTRQRAGEQGPASRRQQRRDADVVDDLFGDKADTLADKYGGDFIDDVLRPLAERVMGSIQPLREDYERRRNEEVAQMVGRYFSGLDKSFHTLYGNERASSEQTTARKEVARIADQIMAGAALQGVSMSEREALDRAVAVHAKDHLAQIERQRLASAVKRRSSRLTARPSSRRAPASDNPLKAAEEAVAAKMAEIGING